MKWDLAILNGTLVTADDTFTGNIYVKNEKIAAITEKPLEDESVETIDASGKFILPGFIDSHVHSRDGFKGAHYKEDFEHSSSSGAASGVTTILEMPNCNPAVYCVDTLHQLIDCITPKAHVDFGAWGLCLGDLNLKELLPLNEAGVVGFKFFWGYAIDSKSYQLVYNYKEGMENIIPPLDQGEIYRIFREVAKTDKMIGIHAENFDLIKMLTAEVMAGSDRGYDAVLRSRPPVSETTIINTGILLSKELGTHLHILHLAAGEAVPMIAEAQEMGVDVTAETCPHYLFLTDKDYGHTGSQIKGYPPVRTQWDQDMLWEGLKDGTLSFVCSDHAPHTREEKLQDYWNAPAGMASIETMPLLMIDAVNKGKITINELVEYLSENTARMYNLYPNKGSLEVGTDADMVIVDLEPEYTFHQESMHSRTKLSPYDGWKLKGKPIQTILRGHTTAKDGEPVGEAIGKFIRPN